MMYRRPILANTSSSPVLKEYRWEHIPIEGQSGVLKMNWPTPFSAKIMEAPSFPKVKLPTMEPFDGTTDPAGRSLARIQASNVCSGGR